MNQDVSLGGVRPLSRLRSICPSRQPSREVPEVLLEKVVRRQAKLEFDVLTDLHLRVAEAFGAAFTLPTALKELSTVFGNALDKFHNEAAFACRYARDTSSTSTDGSGPPM
jgi:hypothetical protein